MSAERTCVVCRKKCRKEDLLRFVMFVEEGKRGLFIDIAATMPGRGAYCHKELACLSDKRLFSGLYRTLLKGKAVETEVPEASKEALFLMIDRALDDAHEAASDTRGWLSSVKENWEVKRNKQGIFL